MSPGQIWKIVSCLSPITLMIGLIVGLLYLRYISKDYRLLIFYLAVAFIMDLLFRYFGYYSDMKYNLFLIPIFGFFELAVFSYLYYKYILKSVSTGLLVFIAIMLLLIISEIFSINELFRIKTFQSFGKVIADVAIIWFCLLYYWEVFNGKIAVKSKYGLLNAAILIYFSINLVLSLPINFLVNEKLNLVIFFWVVNLISMLLFYFLLIYLIWQDGRTRKILQ
jgi:hypothetical protein